MKSLCAVAFAALVGLSLMLSMVPTDRDNVNASIYQTEDEVVLRIGFMDRIDSLNPYLGMTDSSYTFYGLVYDALQGAGNDLEATPNLATECWVVPETDPDMVLSGEPYGSVWQYNITPNAIWHDGTPFTPEDVAWNINLNSEHYDVMWAFQPYTYFIDYAEVYGSDAVRIHFSDRASDEPVPVSFADFLPIYMLPRHEISELTPFEIAFTWSGIFSEGLPLVGTGPFMVGLDLYDEWLSGDLINLYKNPNYHMAADQGLEVQIDRIELHFYDDADALSLALQTGDLDVAKLPVDQYSELKDMVEGGSVENITMFEGLSCYGHWTDVGFNMYETGPNLARLDPAVRQSLAMATDKAHIVDEMYQGYADEGSTLVAPVDEQWHYEPTSDELIPFDPDLANATLEAAGYVFPYEGATVRAATAESLAVTEGWVVEGTELSFEMLVREEYPEEIQISEYLTAAWADVGVALEVLVMSEAELATIVYSYNYDTCIWYWYSEPDPNYILFCESSFAWLGWNDNMYYNPLYDEFYALSVMEMDPELRKIYVDTCQLINYWDVPYIVLAYTYQTYAWRTDALIGWGDWAEDPGRSLDAYWTANPLFFDLRTAENSAPEALSLELPAGDVYAGQWVEFIVSADDVDEDDLYIELGFGDGEAVGELVTSGLSHYELTFAHAYALPGDYDLTVTVDDQTGIDGHVVTYGPVSLTVLEDDIAPVTVADVTGVEGDDGWYVSILTVSLSATDVGGAVLSTEYSLSAGVWVEYTDEIDIFQDGSNELSYRSTDSNGNVETAQTIVLKVDTEVPVVSIDMDLKQTSSTVTADIGWTTGTSGVVRVTASIDGASATDADLSGVLAVEDVEDGEHTLTVTVYDAAGHSSSVTETFEVETSVFALDGPAGPWAIVGLVAALLAVIGVASFLVYRKMKAPKSE